MDRPFSNNGSITMDSIPSIVSDFRSGAQTGCASVEHLSLSQMRLPRSDHMTDAQSKLEFRARTRFGLTRGQWQLLHMLMSREYATYQDIRIRLYNRYSPHSYKITISQHVMRLRRHIRKTGLQIEIANTYDFGYSISETDREKIKEYLS